MSTCDQRYENIEGSLSESGLRYIQLPVREDSQRIWYRRAPDPVFSIKSA
jgi:hypothetical protein